MIFESNSLLKLFESDALSYSSLTNIIIPRNVEKLGEGCFYECTSLHEVTFELNSLLRFIESFAFFSSSLINIIIPRSVEKLSTKCFFQCRSLREVIFEAESSLKIVERSAFSFCFLTEIVIPRSVHSLQSRAFENCQSLTTAIFETSRHDTQVSATAFQGCLFVLWATRLPPKVTITAEDSNQAADQGHLLIHHRFDNGDDIHGHSRFPSSSVAAHCRTFDDCALIGHLATTLRATVDRYHDRSLNLDIAIKTYRIPLTGVKTKLPLPGVKLNYFRN
jgi:hypothetical protein